MPTFDGRDTQGSYSSRQQDDHIDNRIRESIARFVDTQQLNADLDFISVSPEKLIDGLTARIDSLQSLTDELKDSLDAKDREILKIRQIAVRAPKATKKKPVVDQGVQTVLNVVQTLRDEERTYSKLYDNDQALIRSEKQALLRYMRDQVL